MSLSQMVLALLSKITDPKTRIDLMTTINYLKNVYMSGRGSDEEIKKDLRDVAAEIIRLSNPDLLEEEIAPRAEVVAEELFRRFKLESMRYRLAAKYKSKSGIIT